MAESSRYLIPAGLHRVSEEITRSRFITSLGHCSSKLEAEEFIATIRAEFSDASHNCWAYNASAPKTSSQVGMSDDGEPHGSAGRPMLNVISLCSVGEIVAVVTRYYGGTKLGTGGLARAYSGGVKLALESLPTIERIDWRSISVTIDYPLVDQFRLLFPVHEVKLETEEFTDRVSYQLRLPQEHSDSFRAAVIELSSGRAEFH